MNHALFAFDGQADNATVKQGEQAIGNFVFVDEKHQLVRAGGLLKQLGQDLQCFNDLKRTRKGFLKKVYSGPH